MRVVDALDIVEGRRKAPRPSCVPFGDQVEIRSRDMRQQLRGDQTFRSRGTGSFRNRSGTARHRPRYQRHRHRRLDSRPEPPPVRTAASGRGDRWPARRWGGGCPDLAARPHREPLLGRFQHPQVGVAPPPHSRPDIHHRHDPDAVQRQQIHRGHAQLRPQFISRCAGWPLRRAGTIMIMRSFAVVAPGCSDGRQGRQA
jgi:hypothetical protein